MTSGWVLLGVLLAGNVWATRRVLRSDMEGFRIGLFVASIWMVPFFGWLIVKAIAPPAPEPGVRPGVLREEPPSELRVGAGPALDLSGILGQHNGVPFLDWRAIFAWSGSHADPHDRDTALQLARRAWLHRLRDALGPHFHLDESPDAILLSSLDEVRAKALLRYVGTTRSRVARVLQDVAAFAPGSQSIVLVVDDDDSYYHYLSTYEQEGGEAAFSSGVYLHGDCPHFVAKFGELTAIEPVIAHELTHSAVAHLQLPLWLDEGIAVNTEQRLVGAAPRLETARQLREKHLAFWNADRIQEFWSGASFRRTDDGNTLSYDLARILVDHFSRDWLRFAAFALQARREDAGEEAARSILGVDLGAAAAALLEAQDPQGWSPGAASWLANGAPAAG